MKSNQIISREEERHLLDECFDSNQPEFIAIYGRRRVGKTFLIRNVLGIKKKTIFLNATGTLDGPLSEQIENFTQSIAEAFYHKKTKLEVEKNWRKTFQKLNDEISEAPKNKKIILFFDEFPWMDTKNARLLPTLSYFWNQYWSRDPRIKLVICGSASGWILKNIIHNQGGLYHRVTKSIQLEPFNLSETKKFLSQRGIKLDNKQIVELYMVLGGIPYYLAQIRKGLSAVQVVEQLAFSKTNFLLGEFDELFATLFRNAKEYIEIVRTIAQHRYGMGQEGLVKCIPAISSGGRLGESLKNLEDAGFIMSFMPKWHKRRGIYYKIIDEYTLFYFYWIEPLKKQLLIKGIRPGYWEQLQQGSTWQSWKGYAFEAVCYKHLPQIGQALNLNPANVPCTWKYIPTKNPSDRGTQIDLLFDRNDDCITLCEIKYTKQPFIIDKSYAENLKYKIDVFKKQTRTRKQIFLAMISANGLKPTLYSEELISNIVTLEHLFK